MSDFRLALRRLRLSPLFTVFGIVTLALGIGGATGVFSVVRAATGPVPGVRHLDRIVNVSSRLRLSWPDYRDLRASQNTFQTLTAWSWFRATFAARGQSGTSSAEIVGGEYFTLLGVTPVRGRLLQPADDVPSAPAVVVLGHATWLRVFGGAEDIVGQTMRINGQTFEIVGVAPAEFHGVFNDGLVLSALWVPLSSAPAVFLAGRPFDAFDGDHQWLSVKGALKAGAALEHARAEVTGIAKSIDQRRPIFFGTVSGGDRRQAPRMWSAERMADERFDPGTGRLVNVLVVMILAAIGVVLLVVCTNLANLSLARGTGRRAEYAVRLALGAGRWRLIRESLTESAILAAAGCLGGLGVARVIAVWLSGDLAVNGAPVTLHLDVQLDAIALAVCVAATGLALAVAGLVPAVQSTRPDLRAALVSDASQGGVPRWRGRRVLIAGQVCVSVVLLGLAALCAVQLRGLQQDPGFALSKLAVAQVDFGAQGYDDVRTTRAVDAFLRQMPAHPSVSAVTVTSALPVGIVDSARRAFVSGPDVTRAVLADVLTGGTNAFQTLGVPLTHGRAWDGREPAGARVVVLSEFIARQVFGTTDVVGRTVQMRSGAASESREIIGVAGDTDVGSTGSRDHGLVYVPYENGYPQRVLFLARTEGDVGALVSGMRDTLRAIDRELAIELSGTGPTVIGSPLQFFQFSAEFATLLGTFAWVLALAGLYGLLSHVVLRRTREIGLRVALGATRRDIIAMVVGQGLRPVVLGAVVGLGVTALANVALQSFFRLSLPIADLMWLALAPLVFAAAAVLACYLPARRAASVDPNVALRQG